MRILPFHTPLRRQWFVSFFQRNRVELILTAAYLIALLVVWPAGNFALNDDWTYGRSVMLLHDHGKLVLGTSSASLVTHLYWGLLFVKVFGFSFTLLRITSWISVCIFIWLSYKLMRRVTGSTVTSAVFVLAMVFNPIFFSVSNTFMTDVNFCTLIVCCIWSAWNFWNRQKTVHFVAFFVFSLMLVFIRQFGILVPAVFIVTCLMLRQRKLMWAALSVAALLAIFFLLLYFESSVVAAEKTGYQSPAKYNPFSGAFWEHIRISLAARHENLASNTSVWTAPILLIYLWPFTRMAGYTSAVIALGLSCWLSYLLFESEAFPLGNIFYNMTLGAETFYESLTWPRAPRPHTFSDGFKDILDMIGYLSVVITLTGLLLLAILLASGRAKVREPRLFVFSLLFALGYMFSLIVPDIFFDRYHLPLPIAFGFMLASVHPERQPSPLPSLIYLIPMIYVSLAGTNDYFRLHRLIHDANDHLRHELGVPMNRINAGHEINNWHEGQEYVTWETLFISSHNYLIQYNSEPGFTPYRAYPFRRLFPPKNDKIYIFERIDKIPN